MFHICILFFGRMLFVSGLLLCRWLFFSSSLFYCRLLFLRCSLFYCLLLSRRRNRFWCYDIWHCCNRHTRYRAFWISLFIKGGPIQNTTSITSTERANTVVVMKGVSVTYWIPVTLCSTRTLIWSCDIVWIYRCLFQFIGIIVFKWARTCLETLKTGVSFQ